MCLVGDRDFPCEQMCCVCLQQQQQQGKAQQAVDVSLAEVDMTELMDDDQRRGLGLAPIGEPMTHTHTYTRTRTHTCTEREREEVGDHEERDNRTASIACAGPGADHSVL